MTNSEQNKMFEELLNNTRKTIRLDLSGCMGGSTGGLMTFKRVRKGKPKIFRGGAKGGVTRQCISLVADLPNLDETGQVKWKSYSGYRLWRSQYGDGSVSFSASVGNMGILINKMEP